MPSPTAHQTTAPPARSTWRGGGGHPRGEDERSSGEHADAGVAALGWVIAMPVFMLLVLSVVQAGYFFHGRDVALSAAQVGLAQARTATGASGTSKAAAFATEVGGHTLTGVHASSTRTATTVTITVTGRPVSLVPGVRLPTITATANAPRERFTTPERP